MNGMNLDHLRTLVDVAELGSFSAAADRQRVSQPAVSQQIRQLERRIGLRLVERVGRRAQLTAAGQELVEHARDIDAAVARALDAMARHATEVTGTVRLGTGASACIYLLPPILRRLRQRFPKLRIVVRTENTGAVLSGLMDNSLDLGFVTLPASGRMFWVTPILDDAFVAIDSAEHPLLPVKVVPAAFDGLPMVLYEAGGNTRHIIDDWLRRGDSKARPEMELGSVEAIKQLVAAGLGCSIVPKMTVDADDRDGALRLHPLHPPLSRKLAVVLRRDKILHRGLREVIAEFEGLAKSLPRRRGA